MKMLIFRSVNCIQRCCRLSDPRDPPSVRLCYPPRGCLFSRSECPRIDSTQAHHRATRDRVVRRNRCLIIRVSVFVYYLAVVINHALIDQVAFWFGTSPQPALVTAVHSSSTSNYFCHTIDTAVRRPNFSVVILIPVILLPRMVPTTA